jgi:hypothetical protein
MKKLLVLIPLLVTLTGCYDGSVRYHCQEYKNWNKPECNPPLCEAEGECTKDLFTQDFWEKVNKE